MNKFLSVVAGAVAGLMVATSAMAYNFERLTMRSLGESTSTGTYDLAAECIPYYSAFYTGSDCTNSSTRVVPELLLSELQGDYPSIPLTMEYRAKGSSICEFNLRFGYTEDYYTPGADPLITENRPGTITDLLKSPSRIVFIQTSGNDARLAVTAPNIYKTGFTSVNAKFTADFTELINNIRRSGKMPYVMKGSYLQNIYTWDYYAIADSYAGYDLLGINVDHDKTYTSSDYANMTIGYNSMSSNISMFAAFNTIMDNVWSNSSFKDGTTRLPGVLRTINTTTSSTGVLLSGMDGAHAWPEGYEKMAHRTADKITSKIPEIQRSEMAARWYALIGNVGIDSASMASVRSQLATQSVDQVAENVYTASGLNDLQWCTAMIYNCGASALISPANLVTIMNTNTTLKHGKVLNWFIDQINISGSSTPIAIMRNKTSVGFANGYVFNKSTLVSLSTVNSTDSSVTNLTNNM